MCRRRFTGGNKNNYWLIRRNNLVSVLNFSMTAAAAAAADSSQEKANLVNVVKPISYSVQDLFLFTSIASFFSARK